MVRLTITLLLCSVILGSPATAFAGSKEKAELKAKLQAVLSELQLTFKVTKTGLDHLRVTEPGTILVAKQDGFGMLPTFREVVLPYKVINGRINAPSGFWASALGSGESMTQILKAGDRVYVTNIWVSAAAVGLDLLSCDVATLTLQGSTRQARYRGSVVFELPAGESSFPTAPRFKALIDPFLTLESEASAPKTIELGQTIEMVEATLGKPEKILKVGPKTIYVYKDVKIILIDGRVADVE